MPGPDDSTEVEVEEVILGENDEELDRTIRVYDSKGDFTIAVPDGAKVTFGYFNPAAGGESGRAGWNDGPGSQTAKTTALRIYEKGERGNQLACFLGVKGFRDQRIKLTRLQTKLVIEQNFDDDGEGSITFGGKRQAQLVASPEPDTYA